MIIVDESDPVGRKYNITFYNFLLCAHCSIAI